jgi:hypothetical protein
MKKIISILFATSTCIAHTNAQTQNSFSLDQGFTQTNMTRKMTANMRNNGFGATVTTDWSLFLLPFTSKSSYPKTENKKVNYRARYNRHLRRKTSIEAGFGKIYQTIIKGAHEVNGGYDFLSVDCSVTNLYAAFMTTTSRENFGIGLGPALSICKVKQRSISQSSVLSDKTELIPGANLSAYWNFVDQPKWFLGMRTDVIITKNLTIEEVRLSHEYSSNPVTVSKQSTVGANMFTVSFSGGFKF